MALVVGDEMLGKSQGVDGDAGDGCITTGITL